MSEGDADLDAALDGLDDSKAVGEASSPEDDEREDSAPPPLPPTTRPGERASFDELFATPSEPTIAGTSAIKHPRHSSGQTDKLQNELLRARTRQGIEEPSLTRKKPIWPRGASVSR